MRTFIVILIFFMSLNNCIAQNNSIFIELGGNSLGPSLNYQRQIGYKSKLGLRMGIGSAFVSDDKFGSGLSYFNALLPDEQLCIPISINYLFIVRQF